MKRVLPVIVIAVVTLVVAALIADFALKTSWRRAGHREWPDGLGRLEDFPKRFPTAQPTPAALRLIELGRPLGIEFTEKKKSAAPDVSKTIGEYVKAEQERGAVEIEPAPAEAVAFLDGHEREIDTLRDHLLTHGAAIGWSVNLDAGLDAPIPNLLGHMHTARLLTARALVRARAGDPRAWMDLEAVSRLEQSLQKRPDTMSQLISLAIARMANGVAWKLPLPAPASFGSDTDRDHLLLRAWQGEAWTMWRHAMKDAAPFAGQPLMRAGMANMAIHQHDMAEELAKVTACHFDGKEFSERAVAEIPRWNIMGRIALPNIGEAWTRVRRFEAEREATANALRIRAGQPIVAQSRCTDGSWRYENGTLSFTGDLPLTLIISRR
ncbi:MAG TPA: hypothetical protein VNI54_10370 [Thermoanaerobaculia bacterium]|nr:hypothetical protein [Thermoanaerobaculia bacterium]